MVNGIAELGKNQSENKTALSFREKEEFFAIMSHEVFTPMNELVAKVGLLLDSPLNPEQKVFVTTIQKSAQDLLVLLKDMHEFMASRPPQTQAEGL
jgi:signal transduction histidine kinase